MTEAERDDSRPLPGSGWGVCATVNEPLSVLHTFVRHHLSLGATQVILYFDQPVDADMAKLSALPGVTCLASRHLVEDVPEGHIHEQKQIHNYRHAVDHLFATAWCGHIDADEFVMPVRRRQSFGAWLDAIDPAVPAIKLSPSEAVFADGSDTDLPFSQNWARLLIRPADDQSVLAAAYGEAARSLLDGGLAGHKSGKTFIRRAARFEKIALHRVHPVEGKVLNIHNEDFTILHFDAISFPDWARKWRRRVDGMVFMNAMSNNRLAQLEAFAACQGDEAAERQLFSRLFGLSRDGVKALSRAGKALVIENFGGADPCLAARPDGKAGGTPGQSLGKTLGKTLGRLFGAGSGSGPRR